MLPTPAPGATREPSAPHRPHVPACPHLFPAPREGRWEGLRSLPPSPWLHRWGCRPCLQDRPLEWALLWVGLPVTGAPKGSQLSSQVSGVTHTLPESRSLAGGLFTGDGLELPTGAGLGPGLGCCVLSVGSTCAPLNSGSASAPVPAHGPPGGPTARLHPQPRRGAGSSPAGARLLLGVRSRAPGSSDCAHGGAPSPCPLSPQL